MPREEEERLRKDEWYIDTIEQHADAADAIARWHYAQGCPNTSVNRHGLFRFDDPDKIQGVAMWLPPSPTAGRSVTRHFGLEDIAWRGVLSLTRLVVAPDVPANGASFLLGRSMKMVDRARWPILLTYADTGHGHTGAIYKATNWTCLGEVDAGDTWINQAGEQRGRKRGGRNMTAAEMRAEGFERRPAAPKIKFVHRVRSTKGVSS